jgi:hypothetical protein
MIRAECCKSDTMAVPLIRRFVCMRRLRSVTAIDVSDDGC